MTVLEASTLTSAVARLTPITLEAVNDRARLQTRVDRKYVIEPAELTLLIEALAHRLAILEIDQRQHFRYESVYFDTPELDSFLAAARKRRRRFKVRTRTYLDSQTTMLEVKTRGRRKQTVKKRQTHDVDLRTTLDDPAREFVDAMTGRPGIAAELVPVLTTAYDRITLIDLDDVARLTVDTGLRCTSSNGRTVGLRRHVIVETKSTGTPSAADRWLWQHGLRPATISKFGTGMAALDPSLPANKWHRALRFFDELDDADDS